MKLISEHVGRIIVALACVALLISSVALFKAPIGGFFGSIVDAEKGVGDKILANIDGVEVNFGNTAYTIIEGAGQEYQGSGPITFRSNAPYNKFVEVKVDGETVHPDNYTVTEGSTVVTFTDEYSATLAAGEHTISIVSTDGVADTGFTVVGSSETETLVAGATFNDGTFLAWEDLKSTDNGSKYGYDASAISDTSIGFGAFVYCNNLTSITIPDSVTSIGDAAFAACINLTSITIPDRVTSIGLSVFYDCTSLTSVTIPDSVTSIGDEAFRHCSGLTNITIPDSVTSIGSSTFFGCSSLANITIGNSITSIGDEAFTGCSSLQNITFKGTKAQWNTISLGNRWKVNAPATVVHCTDGDVAI